MVINLSLIALSISAVVSVLVLLTALKRVAGTTLVGPVLWAIISVASIVVSEIMITISMPSWSAQIRYMAATSALYPAIAVLGAKRPQDRGWTFIIGSLWIVLVLPAAQAVVFGYGSELDLHWAWRYFLLLLVVAGWSNYVLTRFWFASTLLALAQSVLLGSCLPGIGIDLGGNSVPVALTIVAATCLIIWFQIRVPISPGINAVWRDFRDAFGAVWGLRIMERINSLAAQENWKQSLMWSGFELRKPADVPENSGDPPVVSPLNASTEQIQIKQCLRTLLRRFVHTEWIDSRLNEQAFEAESE